MPGLRFDPPGKCRFEKCDGVRGVEPAAQELRLCKAAHRRRGLLCKVAAPAPCRATASAPGTQGVFAQDGHRGLLVVLLAGTDWPALRLQLAGLKAAGARSKASGSSLPCRSR